MWRRLPFTKSSLSTSSNATSSCQSGWTANTTAAGWLRSAVARTTAGAFLLARFDSFKRRYQDDGRRRVTNAQLRRLNRKIDKLLSRLDDSEYININTNADEDNECVVCLSAEATMQTFPCAHRVTCRRCFVRTIQTAISDRILPLRCVVCRARILTLNDPASVDDQSTCSASAARGWIVSASDDRRPKSMDPSKNAEEPAVTKKHLPRMRRKQSSPTCSMAGK